MKKLVSVFTIAACSINLMGCGIPQSQAMQKSQSSQTTSFNAQEIASQQTDTKTISNGRWTITIANMNSWSGVNGTGNLSYRGCDSKGKCINLTNGKISCRNGICVMGWKNGDYVYAIAEPMSESTNPQPSKTTLSVHKGSLEILRETGFKTAR